MTLDLHEIATLFNISMHSTREMVVRTIRSLQNIKIEQLNISVKDRNLNRLTQLFGRLLFCSQLVLLLTLNQLKTAK